MKIMASKDDSRPFAVLRQNSLEFRDTFDADIQTCLDLLDSQLKSLICDPDSLSPTKDAKRLGAHLEFSKAKLEIFQRMKDEIEDMESKWKELLSNMIGNFLENVEILLASTTLNMSHQSTKKSGISKRAKSFTNSASAIASSMSPYSLLNKAKNIPVLNSFLSKQEAEEDSDQSDDSIIYESCGEVRAVPLFGPSISQTDLFMRKSVSSAINSSLKFNETSKQPVLKKKAQMVEVVEYEASSDEDETPALEIVRSPKSSPSPVKRNMRSAKESAKSRKSAAENKIVSEDPESRKQTAANKAISKEPDSRKLTAANKVISEESVKSTPTRKSLANRKSILKLDHANDLELHATPSRSTRKRTAVKESIQVGNTSNNGCEEESETSAVPKTPKNVHFSVGLDVNDDLEIYSPVIQLTRSAPRRKTVMLSDDANISSELSLTPNVVRSKRKTIGGSAVDVSGAPPPKRYKRGNKASATPRISEEKEEDLLEKSDELSVAEHYTSWLPLDDVDYKVPAQPGVFELKVYKAKKSAYIGNCDNLRQKLTLYRFGENSGHKHLDKFLERNKNDIQFRYEKFSSAAQATSEGTKRLQAFVALYRTTPAYN